MGRVVCVCFHAKASPIKHEKVKPELHVVLRIMAYAINHELESLANCYHLFQFLLAILGLNAANSNFACIYCKIHKDDR